MSANAPDTAEQIVTPSAWLGLSAMPVILVAGYFLFPGDFNNIILLAISIFVAVLLHKQTGQLPRTRIGLSAKLTIVFWGVLNLGVAGGALVAGAAALAGLSDFRGRRMKWARATVIDLTCSILAGLAFGAVSGFSNFAFDLPTSSLVPNQVLFASAAMLAAYQVSWSALRFLFLKGPLPGQLNGLIADANFFGNVISVTVAITLFAAFRHFGSEFGLVVLPVAIVSHLSHQMHLRRLGQKTREIVDASRLHLATVEALATAIDARDQVGVGHVRRTQIYSVGIGTALGLGDDELNALRAAALLHDIGKLAVPEHILNKPGRLTSAELEKTKVHSSVGASILEKVGFPYPVVPTVRHHHEFWDGSGYPSGLSGERIPLTARILSVADAYDALRGTRPYRSGVSRDDACNFLRSRAGTQFDPHVVNTFLRNLKELEAEVEIHGFGYGLELVEQKETRQRSSYVEQIKRANQEVFSLYEMARDFGASSDLDSTLRLLSQKVQEFVPYETCIVYLLDDDGTHATATHVTGRNSDALAGKRIAAGEGASGYVLKKRKPVENVDPSLDFAFSHPEICNHYVGMASVPLLADERLVGVISVFSGKLAVYEEEHLRLLETISRIAADAISKSIKHAESEIYALTDPLTGLPNARCLQLQFEKEVGRARRSGKTLQMLMLDLDGFKAVNDNFGHKAGDSMLKEVGRLIKGELRDYDFLARYGGDEFIAIVPDIENSDVIELCARIEAAVESYAASYNETGLSVGVSIGSANYPGHGESFEDLLIAADKAMYRTKAFHKQRLMPFETGPNVKIYEATTEQIVNERAAEASFGMPIASELVVELDESHILTINTVN